MQPAASRNKPAAYLACVAGLMVILTTILSPPPVLATGLPDLSIARSGPASAAVRETFLETLTITNHGTASTPRVQVNYSPGIPTVSGGSAGGGCVPMLRGHSGRGGGYTRVGWTCSETVSGGLAPGRNTTIRLAVTQPTVANLVETFTVLPSPSSAQLNRVSHSTWARITVFVPPPPAAPTNVSASQVQDQLNVSWTPSGATASYLTSSVITAIPTGGSTAPVLTATVSGPVTTGAVPEVQPSTTYSVTVSNRDAGGAGPASAPILVTTQASTTPPLAPSIQRLWWANTNLLAVSWQPGTTGDSPIDQFEVMATASDSDATSQSMAVSGSLHPMVVYVNGSATSAYIRLDDTLSWSVTVRAHNTAGWGLWSTARILGGL